MLSSPSLTAHAAKSGVCKLVMRLEPVAECAAQHTGRGARRSAFQDEVLAVEEIGGVSAVEREWFESGERCEFSRGPLPSIAQHAVNAECALALGKCVHRRGAPAGKIEVAMLFRGLLIAPRVFPLIAVRGPIRSALPLGFSGQ